MSYSKLSTGMAHYISREIGYDSDKEEVIAYSIESIILNVISIVLASIIGFLTHALLGTLVAVFAGATLRRMSGGAHASTAMKCVITGSVFYSVIGVISKYISLNANNVNIWWLWVIIFFTFIIVLIYAPVDCPAKPIHSKLLRKRLKMVSVIFVLMMILVIILTNNIIIKIAIALGMFYQSLTLLPILNRRR